MMAQDKGEGMPIVEAPREICEYYNKGATLKYFDKAGFFILEGVIVCETGKRAIVEQRMAMEQSLEPYELQKQTKALAEAK